MVITFSPDQLKSTVDILAECVELGPPVDITLDVDDDTKIVVRAGVLVYAIDKVGYIEERSITE